MVRIIPDVRRGGGGLQFKGKNEGEDGDGKPSWRYPPGLRTASRDRAGMEPRKCSTLLLLPSKEGKEIEKDLRTFRWVESVWTGSDQNLLRFFNSESESKSASVVKRGVRLKPDLWINYFTLK